LTAEEFLQLLENVRQIGPGRWLARCPAHDDHRPSLSVKETEDGRLLLYCWAGCETRDILEVLGLEFRDLFPGGDGNPVAIRERRQAATAKKALRRLRERVVDEAAELLKLLDRRLLEAQSLEELEESPWCELMHRRAILEYLWDEAFKKGAECDATDDLILDLLQEVRLWRKILREKN
jgi:hypothetical protein